MKDSIRLKNTILFARGEAIRTILDIVKQKGTSGVLYLDEINLNVPNASEDDLEPAYLDILSMDGSISDTREEIVYLENLSTDFVLEILEKLEDHFEIGKIVNPDVEPSYELVEKYAQAKGYRHESKEDHQDAYYELKGLLQTGAITEKVILEAFEKDETID